MWLPVINVCTPNQRHRSRPHALRNRRKLRFTCRDGSGACSHRTILPVAVACYVQVAIVAGWCETRRDDRHSRSDRVADLTVLDDRFDDPNGKLVMAWVKLPRQGGFEAVRSMTLPIA